MRDPYVLLKEPCVFFVGLLTCCIVFLGCCLEHKDGSLREKDIEIKTLTDKIERLEDKEFQRGIEWAKPTENCKDLWEEIRSLREQNRVLRSVIRGFEEQKQIEDVLKQFEENKKLIEMIKKRFSNEERDEENNRDKTSRVTQ